jgi:hypothetical protein
MSPPARARTATLVFLVGLYCAWLSSGPFPWLAAYHGARSPEDFTRDFIAAQALARGERLSTLDGPRGNAEAVRAGANPVNIVHGSPFHLHPPPASLPMRLLVPLGFRNASIFWLGLSVLLLGVLARLLVDAVARVAGGAPVSATSLFLLLVVWPPALTNFQLGQWSIVLATLLAAGFADWETRRESRGAAWLAMAAALKLTPAAMFPFVALRDRRAAVVYLAVVGAALAAALPLGGGLDAWRAFARDAGTNAFHWQTWWHNTLSIQGFLARLFVGAHFARPLVEAPWLARILWVGAAAALCLTALAATRDTGRPRGPACDGCVFSLWNILVVVLNPLAWAHYGLVLLLPAALILRAADEPGSPLPHATRARLRAAVAVAVVALSVPKETAYMIARPLPSSPATAPLLSLHLFAALLLFAAAALATRALRRAEAPAHAATPAHAAAPAHAAKLAELVRP